VSRRAISRRAGPASLAAILLLAATAPLLAPLPPDLQEDVAGARYLPPLTRAHALAISGHQIFIVNSLRTTPDGWEFVRAGRRDGLPAAQLSGPPAARFYLLGTDALGRDLAARLLFGLRQSALIAALTVALAVAIGAGAGAAAGWLGGRWDAILMQGVDVLRSIPRLLVYLVCASLFPPSALLLVLVLGATTWTGLARIVRAEMLALRKSDLAAAARAAGARPLRTVLRHLLPQMGPVLAVNAALRFADTILLESALSLLGLGAPPPAVSLGGIMASGRDALASAWWIAAWPGLLIAAFLLALRSTAAGLWRISDPPSVV
jgi:peptide/nickel transport system permease protein